MSIPTRLSQENTALAVIDLQDKILAAIHEKERVLRRALVLVKGAAILRLPIIASVQYPKGLGPMNAEIAAAIPGFAPVEKTSFSACDEPAFIRALKSKNVANVIVCGIEAHVCVSQTALDLLRHRFGVFIAADAVSSRWPEDVQAGLNRMRQASGVIGSVEMALFELLGNASYPEFKQIQALIK